jgi:hypothetical protein
MLKDQHLFSVKEVISSHKFRSDTMTTDASKYDAFDTDDFYMKRLVVKSRLTEKMKDAFCTRFDHDPHFYDYPGPVVFVMALDICNASQSFDIEGLQAKMDELKLEDYPGEYITACAAIAQKQFKVIQSGYAPPFHSGSKLLLKFCNTACAKFNRQAYAMLYLVKKFESNFKLADPKSVTTHVDYRKYGPIPLIAWLQK